VTYSVGEQIKTVTLIPATKIAPVLRSTVSFDRSTRTFAYEYVIGNGLRAEQELYSVSFNMKYPTEVTGTPSGWRPIQTPSTSRLSWYRIPAGGVLSGVRQGEEVGGFQVSSRFLPGPSETRVKGNAPAIEIPSDLPPDVVKRLDAMLIQRNFLMEWAITPVIPVGDNEPELTPEVLTSRIAAAYYGALGRSRHQHRAAIVQHLHDAVRTLATDRAKGLLGVRHVQALARQGGADTWATSMGHALALALEYVTDTFVAER
jgi:hypothetical protein